MNKLELAEGYSLPANVAKLAALFPREKPLYLVGGAVRDLVLGKLPSDYDFTTAATPDEIIGFVKKWADSLWTVGKKFGTIGVIKKEVKYEITTFRTEQYEEGSRKPEVQYTPNLQEDLSRRDFTINAMAYDIQAQTIYDPYGGLRDLQELVLKTPGPVEVSFKDDPLRMLRAIVFSANLRVAISEEVWSGIETFRDLIANVSKERIAEELNKILVGNNPGIGLGLLERSGLAVHFIPELTQLNIDQPGGYHHKNLLKHTLQVVENTAPDLVLRWAAFLHDIAKPATRSFGQGEVHFYGHDILGGKMARDILRRLRFSRDFTDKVSKLVSMHMRPHLFREGVWTDSAIRRYMREAGTELDLLNQLATADCTTMNPRVAQAAVHKQKELENDIERVREKDDLLAMRPYINGNQIMERYGLTPGPRVGEILNALMDAQIEGDVEDEEQAWEFVRERFGPPPSHEPETGRKGEPETNT